MLHSKTIKFVFLLCFVTTAQAYVVKKGDTLASIVIDNYTIRAYGPNGGVEKLIKINKQIQDNKPIFVGMSLKLNKEYLKPGVVDNVPETPEDKIEKVVSGLDAAKPLAAATKNSTSTAPQTENTVVDEDDEKSPYVQVEKYDQATALQLQKTSLDDISFYALYKFNNVRVKNLVSFQEYTVNSTTETELGFEYSRSFSQKWGVSALVAFNHFSIPVNATLTTNIKKSENSQALAHLGLSFKPSSRTDFKVSLMHRPYFYSVLDQNNDIELEYKPSVAYGLQAKNYFYHTNDLHLGLSLGLNYVNNSKVSGNGIGFSSAFVFEQIYKSGDKAQLEIAYEQVSLDSSQLNSLNNAAVLKFVYVPDF